MCLIKYYQIFLSYEIHDFCMTNIMPSSELRNSYNKVSEICRETSEPIYLTKNGRYDTVIMSIEAFENMSRMALLYKIEEGIRELDRGEKISADEAIKILEESLGL